MPWTPADAHTHAKGLTEHQTHVWAHVANSALAACLKGGGTAKTCDGKAISEANAVAARAPKTAPAMPKAAPLLTAAFELPVEFKSVAPADDGSLRIRGYASTYQTDRDREAFTPAALTGAVNDYLRNPLVLLQHNRERVMGRVTSAEVSGQGVLVEAHIPPPVEGTERWFTKAFHDVKQGMLRAFSVGGTFHKSAGGQITRMDWMETSIVSIPANPGALFDLITKAFAAEDGKRGRVLSASNEAELRQGLDDLARGRSRSLVLTRLQRVLAQVEAAAPDMDGGAPSAP